MIYATKSAARVIDKVYRDLKPNDSNWEQDALEWIGEAVEFVRCFPQLVALESILTVSSHAVALPSNMIVFEGLFYAGPDATVANIAELPKYPLNRSTATLHQGLHTTGVDDEPDPFGESYTLNPDFIHTSFEDGVVLLTYRGFKLDANGYPLIPDHPSFDAACFWYILRQMMMGGFVHPDRNIHYIFVDSEWKRYATQARNALKFPDVDQYDDFMRSWVRLVPDYAKRNKFFDEDDYRVNPDAVYGNSSFAP